MRQNTLLQKKWVPLLKNTEPTSHRKEVKQTLQQNNLPPAILNYVIDRGLTEEDDLKNFLLPTLSQLPSPFEITDMERAVDRVVTALLKKEHIAIYGDFDVDGSTSSALLKLFFKQLGVDATVRIPHRTKEGYGLNNGAMKTLKKMGVDLIITVDCGIASIRSVEKAKYLGMDVIITDHHQQHHQGLPSAYAIIDPNRDACDFPDKEMAGVGLAFYLAYGVCLELDNRGLFPTFPRPNLKSLLDLVALGTVADVAKLTGINRILVSAGLRQINERDERNRGIDSLIKAAGIKGKVKAGDLGYKIGPRINAGSRMGLDNPGAVLLYSEDEQERKELTSILSKANEDRKEEEARILEEAVEIIERDKLYEKHSIVVAKRGWSRGVIGIVASSIVERYYKPTILLTYDEDDLSKSGGSARSIPGVNILSSIATCEDVIGTYGGHKAAAGLSVPAANIQKFYDMLDKDVREKNDPKLFTQYIPYMEELKLDQISTALVDQISILGPFGRGNSAPRFIIPNVLLFNADPYGKRKDKERHLTLLIKQNENTPYEESIKCNLFNAYDLGVLQPIMQRVQGDKAVRIDILGSLSRDDDDRKKFKISVEDLIFRD